MRHDPVLELESVSRHWRPGVLGVTDAVAALTDCTAMVRAGEILAVAGPSGSGKSTLLLVASGKVAPSAGIVRWCGSPDPLAARPQLLGARPWEYAFLTVRQALSFHADVLASVDSALPAPTRYVPLMREVGLSGKARMRLGALSALDRLRVVIAQGLLSRPRLLCLDDPFVFCSPAERRDGIRLLRSLAERGMALLIAGRDADACGGQGTADRVLLLAGGRSVDAAPARRSVLELMVPSPEEAIARLASRLPSVVRRGRRLRVPLRGTSPEAVLAACRDVGVAVRASRVAEEALPPPPPHR